MKTARKNKKNTRARVSTKRKLRLVFSKLPVVVCGMCRREYKRRVEAVNCLHDCVEKMLKDEPIKLVKVGLRKAYKCQLCLRLHETAYEAEICVNDCYGHFHNKTNREVKSAGMKFDKDPRKNLTFKKTKLEVVSTKLLSIFKGKKEDDSSENDQKPVETNTQGVTAVPSAEAPIEETATPVEKKEGKKKDPNNKWHRKGANYHCNVCSAQYYTKIEVLACWDGH